MNPSCDSALFHCIQSHQGHFHPVSTICFLLTRYLYKDELIPKNTKIIGYARSDLTVDKLRAKVEPFMKVSVNIITLCLITLCLIFCTRSNPNYLWWKEYGSFFSGTTNYKSKGLSCKAGDCVLL